MNIIEVKDLQFSYEPGQPVLRGLDLSIERGAVVGLLGRNGAGKTTLLRSLLGLMRPSGGTVRLFDADPIADGAAIKPRIGYVSEDQILPEHLSLDILTRMFRELFADWDNEFVSELAARFRLPGNTRIKALSKGQARQVAFLCAIGHRPELLILDEPGSGVDPVTRRELLEAAVELLAQSGSTILFSSHHVTDVERLANRIVVLEEGRVALAADLDELKERYCVVTADYTEATVEQLRAIPACLRIRTHRDVVYAVVAAAPEALESHLVQLPGASAACVSLEELFIHLVGGEA